MTLADYGFKEEPFVQIFVLLSVLTVIVAAIGVVLYAVRAIALYKMAEKTGLDKKYYAFIPFLNRKTCGDIARKSNNSKLGNAVMVITIVKKLIYAVFFTLFGIALIKTVFAADAAMAQKITPAEFELAFNFSSVKIFEVISGALYYAESVAMTIVYCEIYKIFDRKKTVIFTVFGLIFPFLHIFFLNYASKKNLDNGDNGIILDIEK